MIGSLLERYPQLQDRITYMDYHARLESRPKDAWEAVICVDNRNELSAFRVAVLRRAAAPVGH